MQKKGLNAFLADTVVVICVRKPKLRHPPSPLVSHEKTFLGFFMAAPIFEKRGNPRILKCRPTAYRRLVWPSMAR